MSKNFIETPQNDSEIKKVLRKQIALLAEESEKHKDEPERIVSLSESMNKIAFTLFTC